MKQFASAANFALAAMAASGSHHKDCLAHLAFLALTTMDSFSLDGNFFTLSESLRANSRWLQTSPRPYVPSHARLSGSSRTGVHSDGGHFGLGSEMVTQDRSFHAKSLESAQGQATACFAGALSGATPRILRGTARLGNPDFGIAMDLAPRFAACVLAVSAGPATMPGPIGVDLSLLLWPLGAIGPQVTDGRGLAIQPLPLPNLVSLRGRTLYFQWAAASPTPMGFCATPTAKVILWP